MSACEDVPVFENDTFFSPYLKMEYFVEKVMCVEVVVGQEFLIRISCLCTKTPVWPEERRDNPSAESALSFQQL